LLSEAAFLLNLSTDPGETFGFNLIEAKTYGLPVVCTKWDGFTEVVNDEMDGLFVDCSWDHDLPDIDMDSAILCCSRILRDASFRLQLSNGAFQTAYRYEYKRVVPLVINEIQNAGLRYDADASGPIFEDLRTASLSDLKSYYTDKVIEEPRFSNDRYFKFFTEHNDYSYQDWMPIAKSFIHHFAGGKSND